MPQLSGVNNPLPSETQVSVPGYSSVDSPPENLVNTEPSSPAVITTVDPWYTVYQVNLSQESNYVNGNTTFEDFFVASHNVRAGGQIRIATSSVAGAPPPYAGLFRRTRARPYEVATQTGVDTGDINALQDYPDAPDGSVLSGPNDWEALLTFSVAAVSPKTGEDLQCFVLRVNKIDTNAELNGEIAVHLYQSGSLVTDLGTQFVSEDSQILIFPFDAADLPVLAADVQCKVIVTKNQGTGFSGPGLALDAIVMEAEAGEGGSSTVSDSGWLTVQSSSVSDFATLPLIADSLLWTLPSPSQDVGVVYLAIRNAYTQPQLQIRLADSIPSSVSVGMLGGGETLQFKIENNSLGLQILLERPQKSKNGSAHSSDEFGLRSVEFTAIVELPDRDRLLELTWRWGRTLPFFVSGLEASTSPFTSFLGYFERNVRLAPMADRSTYRGTVVIAERL